MDFRIKQLIETRARVIFRLAEEYLKNVDPADEMAGEGFRFAYLLLNRPKQFLSAFREANTLRINPSLVDDFVWSNHCKIPGAPELTEEERQIIFEHNQEVDALEARSHGSQRTARIVPIGSSMSHEGLRSML